jgi:hypothetical protein
MNSKATLLLLGLLLAAGGAVAWWSRATGDGSAGAPIPDATVQQATAPQSTTPSPWLNTSPDVAYVGSDACAECHQPQQASHLQTPHSRALAEIRESQEPPDGEFVHAASNRKYQVYRRDGKLRHRELLASDETVELADHPLRYLIGSGENSRSYLVESGGFLIESPVTWYRDSQAWAMSPGYDAPRHAGFERMVGQTCLDCHAGRVEPVQSNRFRVQLQELSIGCESCHGPGQLHVQRHSSGSAPEGEQDWTIVHPARLSRAANEDVCARCHMQGVATILRSGKNIADFRPGLRLTDYRIEFGLQRPNLSMRVVGHFEQMRLSRCYSQSSTMTCTTCHNPHQRPADAVAHYRNTCLRCHELDSCGVEHAERLRQDARDNCVSCHMPRSPTDIPHFAFTHHRIAVHQDQEQQDTASGAGTLVPLGDIEQVPLGEMQRCLGLANFEYGNTQPPPLRSKFLLTARAQLQAARQQGFADVQVQEALARFHWEEGERQQTIELATAALQLPANASSARDNALYMLAESLFQLQRAADALPYLEELVTRRRNAEDWHLLAYVRRSTGDLPGAVAALEQAVEINGARADVRGLLADLYQLQQDPRASQQRSIWRALQRR